MNRTQFLDRLNRRAARYSVRVSDRVLSDWIDKDLIPGPKPAGRKRIWCDINYRRALQICRFKGLGATRYSTVRVLLWLRGADIDLDWMRESLDCEAKRLKSKLLRGISSTYDPRSDPPLTERKATSLVRQMGQLADAFAPIKYGNGQLTGAYGFLRFNDQNCFDDYIINLVFQIIFGHIFCNQVISDSKDATKLMGGFLGDDDEIERTLAESIANASLEGFVFARRVICVLGKVPHCLQAFVKLMPASMVPERLEQICGSFDSVLRNPEWRIFIFLLFLHFWWRCNELERLEWVNLMNWAESTTITDLVSYLREYQGNGTGN